MNLWEPVSLLVRHVGMQYATNLYIHRTGLPHPRLPYIIGFYRPLLHNDNSSESPNLAMIVRLVVVTGGEPGAVVDSERLPRIPVMLQSVLDQVARLEDEQVLNLDGL